MAIRVFRCTDCGHKMRLAGDACGRCHTPKLPHQRLGLYLAVLALPVAGILLYATVA